MPRHCPTIVLGLIATLAAGSADAEPPALRLAGTIPLPAVQGRIDHLAADVRGQRLFVAALGNDTLEVVDLKSNRREHSIRGLSEPQGVAYLSDTNRVAVANAGDGTCRIFDGSSYQQVASIACSSDADNVRWDAAHHRLYVGYGNGALAEIDLATLQKRADIRLPGHPESFQLQSSQGRILVNVPDARQVVVVDCQSRTTLRSWPLEHVEANFPMALDDADHRLLIGCRKPALLVVLDDRTGSPVASLPCAADADDLFYDAQLRRVYVSGGEGLISVFQHSGPDHYELLATIPTAPGARTSLLVPATHRLYVAAPRRGSHDAEIRIYETP